MKISSLIYCALALIAAITGLAQIWFRFFGFEFYGKVLLTLGVIAGCTFVLSFLKRDAEETHKLESQEELK